jgi:predicted phosphohydrolase
MIAGMARQINAWQPDVVALAGDLAESLASLRQLLDALRHLLGCPIVILPGNHDLWARGAASVRLWEELLPRLVEECGCLWLEGKAWLRDGIALAGTIAWYDYSAADPNVVASEQQFAERKRWYNADARYIDWRWTDPQFAEVVAKPFLETLDRLEGDPAVRQVVVVTHVPLLECQMCRDSGNPDWAFSNAYFGNLTLGAKVLERRKVRHVVSGHTHVARRGQVQTPDGRTVDAVVINSDYGEPDWEAVEL